MSRKELVGAVATHIGTEFREVDKALRGMTEVIEAVAAKGEQVTISGFAKFAASTAQLAWPGTPSRARR